MQQIKDPENKAYWQKYKLFIYYFYLFIYLLLLLFLNSNIHFMVSGNWWVNLLKKGIANWRVKNI
jgi:hypothetical protein